jgi:two-component system LytT family response regulator
MKMKAIIVDDEKNAVSMLESKINKISEDVVIIGKAYSVKEAFEVISNTDFDLLFLDIKLRDGTGFSLLQQFSEINFEIIFTTAFNQYAIEAFKVSAVDYLLKPINNDDLSNSILRAKKRLVNKSDELFENLSVLFNQNNQDLPTKMAIKERGKITFVDIDDVACIKADGVYSEIVLENGQKFITSSNLGYYEKLLNPGKFLRIHRSHIINLSKVSEYLTTDHLVKLDSGQSLPVSSHLQKELLAKLGSM